LQEKEMNFSILLSKIYNLKYSLVSFLSSLVPYLYAQMLINFSGSTSGIYKLQPYLNSYKQALGFSIISLLGILFSRIKKENPFLRIIATIVLFIFLFKLVSVFGILMWLMRDMD